MKVKQIKIDFYVTQEIKRFVYVYFVEMEGECVLVDSGVAGSEMLIEKAIIESGHKPCEIKAVFLTHAHPDHIGTAGYFREKYGAKIYASEGERGWIEDIDLQFKERPIPNFHNLAGKSTIVDYVVGDGDKIYLSDKACVDVIGTAGHSFDELSYRIGDNVFIGDAVPVRGDIPIFINSSAVRNTLSVLNNLHGVNNYYPAWDQAYSEEMMKEKIEDAISIVDELERMVRYMELSMVSGKKTRMNCEMCSKTEAGMSYETDSETESRGELSFLVSHVCERLKMPMWKNNPLFARTIECLRIIKN
ncbi:MAG: MBL fold metallo-hydrolase [Lachnospira sp.]